MHYLLCKSLNNKELKRTWLTYLLTRQLVNLFTNFANT